MRLNLNHLTIRNFSSIEEEQINIKPGFHLILGENKDVSGTASNGSGKSSIFDALSWCFYKKSSRHLFIRKGEDFCSVSASFSLDNEEYQIERTQKNKASSLKLYKNSIDISMRNATESDKELQQILYLPFTIYTSSVCLAQSLPINFASLSPVLRKTYLENLLNLSLWDFLRERISSKSKVFNLEARSEEKEYNSMLISHSKLNERKNTVCSMREHNLNEIHEEIAFLRKEMDRFNILIQETKKKKENLESRLILSRQASNERKNIQSRIDAIQHIFNTEHCDICKQKVSDKTGLSEESSFLIKKRDRIDDLTQSNQHLEVELIETNQLMLSYQDRIKSQQTLISKNDSMMNESQIKMGDLSVLDQELNQLEEALMNQESTLKEIKDQLSHLSYIDSLILPSSSLRSVLIERYLGYFNQLIQEVASIIFPSIQLTLALSSNASGIEIQLKNSSYLDLSGGEKKRVDIILILVIQRFLLTISGFQTNFFVFDEIFDSLDQIGMESVIQAISSLYDLSQTSLFLISHNSYLKSLFYSIIKVEKNNDVSTIDFSGYNG